MGGAVLNLDQRRAVVAGLLGPLQAHQRGPACRSAPSRKGPESTGATGTIREFDLGFPNLLNLLIFELLCLNGVYVSMEDRSTGNEINNGGPG